MFNKTTGKKRVAIYCRVSTDEQVQHGSGLEIQKKALENYVKLNDHQYTLNNNHVYIDAGKSGANKEEKDRPLLYKMFQSAQNGEFDIVLVWKIDRFFRKTLYLLEGIEALESIGVGFISITQPFDTTQPFGKMMLQMMGVIAELERELIKERTHSGILASMNKGKWGRGQCPLGYRKDKDGYLIVYIEEKEIIKLMYKLLVTEELSISEIGKKLNTLGIATQGTNGELGTGRKENIKHNNFWHRGVIHKVLSNELYTGKLIQNRYTTDKQTKKRTEKPESEWIINDCPSIISKNMFNKAQGQLQKNNKFSPRNKKENTVYMLGGLMSDKQSGFSYSGYRSSKGTINYRVLMGKSKSTIKVPQNGVSGNKIEGVVWNKVKTILLQPELLEIELAKLSKLNDEGTIDKEIHIIESNIKKLELKNKNIINFSEGLSTQDIETIKDTINENRLNIEKYQSQVKELNSKKISETEKKQQLRDLKKLSKKVRGFIINDDISYEAKTLICRNLIDKIIINGENVEITLIIPDTRKREKGDHKKEVVEKMFNNTSDFIKKVVPYKENNASLSKENVELCHYIGGARDTIAQHKVILYSKVKRSR